MMLFSITIGGKMLSWGWFYGRTFFYYGSTCCNKLNYILRKKANYLHPLIILGAFTMPYAPTMLER
jgi:hypothetical protein